MNSLRKRMYATVETPGDPASNGHLLKDLKESSKSILVV